jgi:hypothetical protein
MTTEAPMRQGTTTRKPTTKAPRRTPAFRVHLLVDVAGIAGPACGKPDNGRLVCLTPELKAAPAAQLDVFDRDHIVSPADLQGGGAQAGSDPDGPATNCVEGRPRLDGLTRPRI